MIIRDMVASDLPELQALHKRMEIDYQFPRIGPLFLVRKVAVDGNGKIIGSLLFKLRAEAMLLLEGEPEEKMLAMCELQREALAEAYQKGLDEVDCAVPDQIGFSKRLAELGWVAERDGWTLWTRKTEVS
jgi:hypothetical protein